MTAFEFQDKLPHILNAPKDKGVLRMIVIRPRENERTILNTCALSAAKGAHGDSWAGGCWKTLPDGSPHPDVQIALMNHRVVEAIADDQERRALAGDNLYVDLNLSETNLSPGDRLGIGSAILEITDTPHNGCGKFKQRFGGDVLGIINSDTGKTNHLRGIYAKVVKDGVVSVGDTVTKIQSGARE